MSNLRVDNITDELGTGAPEFPNGFTSTGNVGIGTTTPNTKLSIAGAMNFTGVVAIPTVSASIFSPGAGQIAFGTNSEERMRINSAGNVGIGTDNPTVKLAVKGVGAGVVVYRDDNTRYASLGDTGATDDGGVILYDTAGTLQSVIRSQGNSYVQGGNFGIANNTPAQTLTVDGTIGGTIIASQAQAEAGSDNTKLMTPLRVFQALTADSFVSAKLVVGAAPTYTPTAGMKGCLVIATGGGGGGGGADGSDTASGAGGGGGAAGGTAIRYYTAAEIGASAAITLGAGGSAGAATSGGAGGTGGTTTFDPIGTGTTLSAGGGGAGAGGGLQSLGSQAAGGVGTVPTGGQFNLTGGDGGGGAGNDVAEISFGGMGGSSFWGGAGRNGVIEAIGTADGSAGAVGGGGGGGAVHDTTDGAAGGVGAPGIIFILEFN